MPTTTENSESMGRGLAIYRYPSVLSRACSHAAWRFCHGSLVVSEPRAELELESHMSASDGARQLTFVLPYLADAITKQVGWQLDVHGRDGDRQSSNRCWC